MAITESRLNIEHRYVRQGCPHDTKKPEDFLSLRFEIGVTGRGFYKDGLLKVAGAKRPNLIIGNSLGFYQPAIDSFKRERNTLRKDALKQTLLLGGATALVVSGVVVGVNAATSPIGAAMIGKGVAIGIVAGAALSAIDRYSTGESHKSAILFLTALNDMVCLMHTGKEAKWMQKDKQVEKRRDANAWAFDQATAELLGLGLDLPWAVGLPNPPIAEIELDLPTAPTSARNCLVSPERGAA